MHQTLVSIPKLDFNALVVQKMDNALHLDKTSNQGITQLVLVLLIFTIALLDLPTSRARNRNRKWEAKDFEKVYSAIYFLSS